jgi:aminoglycoside phosphotransferase (APT) family kinase protein
MESRSGIDAERVQAWFVDHVPGVAPPLRFTLIAGGHSNLTYRVDDAAGRSFALRRPPLGHVLATAHDVVREHRIVHALSATSVPVARPVGVCRDEEVNGAPFFVMDFVGGSVTRDVPGAEALTPAQRTRASASIVEALADIHAVDVDAVGLGDLARHDSYIERQLRRWRAQYQATRTRDLPAMDKVPDILAANIPPQGPAGLVHGDFRLDNCILDDAGNVAAVLDWELCTIGDVLADVGLLLVYWTEPGDDDPALDSPPTSVPGFWTREQVIARYEQRSARDLSSLDFYIAFASWRVACILDGVHARYLAGAMGDSKPKFGLDSFARRIDSLAARAEALAVSL